jgi:hypothetical protein
MDENERLPRIQLIDFCEMNCPFFKEHFSLEFDSVKFTSGNISFFEIVALTTIIVQLKPFIVMEFGTFNGRTTLNMALNFNGYLYTVDLPKGAFTKLPLADGKHEKDDELGFIGVKEKLFNNYPQRSAELTRIAEIRQIWQDTANLPIPPYENQIDFMFIDASHSYENCLNDSFTAFEMVNEGGIIAWHDYNGWPGVTKALNEVSECHHWMSFFWIHDTSIVVAKNQKMGG